MGSNGGTQQVDVTIQYLAEPPVLSGMVLIVFNNIVMPSILHAQKGKAARSAEVATLEQELVQASEELQTSQEELKSTNEELQSTNEELPSMLKITRTMYCSQLIDRSK